MNNKRAPKLNSRVHLVSARKQLTRLIQDDGDDRVGLATKPYIGVTSGELKAPAGAFAFKLILDDCGNIDDETEFFFEGAENHEIIIAEVEVVNPRKVILHVTTKNIAGKFRLRAINVDSIDFGEIYIQVIKANIMIPGHNVEWNQPTHNTIELDEGHMAAPGSYAWRHQVTINYNPTDRDTVVEGRYLGKANSKGASSYMMVGLDSNPTNGNSYRDMDYALYFRNGNGVYIYESGSSKGKKGDLKEGDRFAIKRIGEEVFYLINDVVVYTSTKKATGPLGFDSSIYRNTALTDVKVTTY